MPKPKKVTIYVADQSFYFFFIYIYILDRCADSFIMQAFLMLHDDHADLHLERNGYCPASYLYFCAMFLIHVFLKCNKSIIILNVLYFPTTNDIFVPFVHNIKQ